MKLCLPYKRGFQAKKVNTRRELELASNQAEPRAQTWTLPGREIFSQFDFKQGNVLMNTSGINALRINALMTSLLI